MGAPCGGLPAPRMQFAKVVARRRQGGFLQLPCSLGFRLASSATGGARLRPPAAFEKSGGKLAGNLLWVSGGRCWPAAHRERRASFVDRFWSGKIGASFERAENAAAPPRTLAATSNPRASPPPPALRRLPGSAGRMGRTCGGRRRLAAGGRPQGRPPACQTKERGPGPRAPGPALSGRFASCRRPPPPGFPPTPKRQRKSPAFRPTQPRPVHHPEKGGSDREPLRGRLQPSRRAERAFFRRGAATE